jgi:phosphoadenosine phosphosulfate reductase family protein
MRHIVALSGGKDSSVLALALKEREPEKDYEYICTPTGYEMDTMFDHWRKLGELLGKPIRPVMAERSLAGLIQIQRAIPNSQMRWCTRMSKIVPAKQFYLSAAPCVAYVGLRADESEEDRVGIYGEIEGVTQRYPLREWGWGIKEVWKYLDDRGITIPARTDCDRCFFQELHEWWSLWKLHPERYFDAARQEDEIGYTWRNASRDTWPTKLSDLAKEFEKGRRPTIRAKKGVRRRSVAGQIDLYEGREGMCRACTL